MGTTVKRIRSKRRQRDWGEEHLHNLDKERRTKWKDRSHETNVKKETKALKSKDERNVYCRAITTDENKVALKAMKRDKSPGTSGIHSEFNTNCGKHTIHWLAQFLTYLMQKGHILFISPASETYPCSRILKNTG